MAIQIICSIFLIYGLSLCFKRKFDTYSIAVVLFWTSWLLSFFMSLPYLFLVNTILLFSLMIWMKNYHFTLLIPVAVLRLSQILNMPAKYITMISMCLIFILILLFLIRKRKNINWDYIIVAIGTISIELMNSY